MFFSQTHLGRAGRLCVRANALDEMKTVRAPTAVCRCRIELTPHARTYSNDTLFIIPLDVPCRKMLNALTRAAMNRRATKQRRMNPACIRRAPFMERCNVARRLFAGQLKAAQSARHPIVRAHGFICPQDAKGVD